MNSDSPQGQPINPEELITAIRARVRVIAQRHPQWDSETASPKQLTVVNIALQQIVGTDRDARIRILRAVFPDGLERRKIAKTLPSGRQMEVVTYTQVPLWSSSNLTKAQAHVLMELLFHLTDRDSFYVGRPLYQRAISFFTEMVEWTKRPAEQLTLI